MIEKPTREQIQAAFDAQNVELFTALINKCGEEQLSLIQEFTGKEAAHWAWIGKSEWFTRIGNYEDMLLAGLRRIVDLSAPETGLKTNVFINTCLLVINNFHLTSNIEKILMYRNAQGFSFYYLVHSRIQKWKNDRQWQNDKLDKVCDDLRNAFMAKLNVNSDLHDVKLLAKSGLIEYEELFEHLLAFFPEKTVASIFENIPFSDALYQTLWWRISRENPQIGGVQLLLKNKKINCVSLFRLLDMYPRWINKKVEVFRAIDFIIAHGLTDSAQLQPAYDYLAKQASSDVLRESAEYLKSILERRDAQAAVTLRGINRFRYAALPLPAEVVRLNILPKVFDSRVGLKKLREKFEIAIFRGDEKTVARLIRDRSVFLQFPQLLKEIVGFAVTTRGVPLSMVQFLVEKCGGRFTQDTIILAGRDTPKGRYLWEMQKKKAITLLGIFKFKRQHSPVTPVAFDTVQVIAQKVMGQRTALDNQPAELLVARDAMSFPG